MGVRDSKGGGVEVGSRKNECTYVCVSAIAPVFVLAQQCEYAYNCIFEQRRGGALVGSDRVVTTVRGTVHSVCVISVHAYMYTCVDRCE
mmetsp:Transcript_32048/g.83483  ORF Transcript_32048/g.83483 Transcript_32048/m.83483 type:complete len:89 (-) Transcript_32048:19-285(-)